MDQRQQISGLVDKPVAKRVSSEMVVSKSNSQSKYVKIGELARKVFSLIPECEEAEGEALMLLANAVEAKVRSIVQRMLTLAEHRMQPLELNPLYRQLDDPLAQVKFVEEIEMRQYNRKRRAPGVSSEINRRKEQEINRKANEAAQAALGGKKKFSYSGVNNPLLHGIAGGASLQTHRPKFKVLSMRDLQYKAVDALPASKAFSKYHFGGFESKMSRREATQILGVQFNATQLKVKEAHKRIMIANHPDRGDLLILRLKSTKPRTCWRIKEEDKTEIDPSVDYLILRLY
uniref:Transcription initiation factor TFIID subunit 4 n=1 Tax=Ditylenchus dipsaci TaxID=166011 RepID=A0A915CRC9_9BILA